MTQVLSEKLQETLLDMLKTVDWFCEENGIRYFLSFESLLGAVRNNGLVSWQNYINIVMPRNDYERFVTSFKTLKEYRVFTYQNEDNYYYPYAQVKIDNILEDDIVRLENSFVHLNIVPLDNLSGNLQIAQKMADQIDKKRKSLNRNRKLWQLSPISKKSGPDSTKSFLSKRLRKLVEQIDRECRAFRSNEYSEYVAAICADRPGSKEILDAAWFQDYITVPFEYLEARIPVGYEELLKKLYVNFENMPV